jgi:hypothetical protein
MSQIQRGETFVDGQTVTAARLNNLVDLATAVSGLILNQSLTTVSVNDQVLIWDDATNSLKRATLAALFADAVGVTNVGLTMPTATFNVTGTNPITSTGTFAVSWDVQAANTTLCGPPSGTTATPAFRALNIADITPATVPIASNTINWDLGNVFSKTLTVTTGFSHANLNEGQVITVLLSNTGAFGVNWPGTIRWPGGVAHTMTSGVGRHDMCIFRYINGNIWGTFHKDFLL